MNKISFWRPEPVPTNNEKIIVECDFKLIGMKDELMERLLRIPNMIKVPSIDTTIKTLWKCDRGVFMYFNSNSSEQVMVINANSYVSESLLFKLYVQLFEHLELVLLDETSHKFFTVKDFREAFFKKG